MSGQPDPARLEKIGLLVLAFAAVAGLVWIARLSLKAGSLDPNAATLLGAIVTGLVAYGKDIVAAIRGYSTGAQLGKVTDQLANSRPAAPQSPAPSTETNGSNDGSPTADLTLAPGQEATIAAQPQQED